MYQFDLWMYSVTEVPRGHRVPDVESIVDGKSVTSRFCRSSVITGQMSRLAVSWCNGKHFFSSEAFSSDMTIPFLQNNSIIDADYVVFSPRNRGRQ